MPQTRVHQDLIAEVRSALRELAVPEDAGPMQAYMKSEMPYLGVKTTPRRPACRRVYRRHPIEGFAAWRATVLALWREATYREERYAAIDLAGDPAYREHRRLQALPMYREMVVDGAWWDLVDAIAVQQFPDLFVADASTMTGAMREWSASEDLWQRRSAVVCQIKRKAATDLELLTLAVESAMEDKDFFLRKGIGWALREHAKTDADWVKEFCAERRQRLSTLSKREALRNVVPKDELADWL